MSEQNLHFKKKAKEMQLLIDGVLHNTVATETLVYLCDETLVLSFSIICRDIGVHQTKETFKWGMVSVYAAWIC